MGAHREFYERVETYADAVPRHARFVDAYRSHRAKLGRSLDVLDIGCGEHAVLARSLDVEDRYWGTDVKSAISAPLERYEPLNLDEEDLASTWPGQRFDVVFCGEVIEHVFSPDRLLRQIASVSHDETLVVLSTPNLAYWVNRILLLFGFSPLFVENSSEVVLGRRLRRLGQGNPTQGHVRLFTNPAMIDLLNREGYAIDDVQSVPVWNVPGEKYLCRLCPSLGPDTIYLVRPPAPE